jgi:fatty-acyl-CoA synthase
MEARGFSVMHLYGLTETYGPATICEPQPDWPGMTPEAKARTMARQGINAPTLEAMEVLDPEAGTPVAWDNAAIGEIALRGNTVMMGYHRNEKATEEAFKGGWYRSGDLAVRHKDGFAEVKDRSKDIIISGGENVSSLEVEEVLFRHPAVMEAAVVAKPHEHWGEVPCAFVALKEGKSATAEEIIAYARERLAGFKTPKHIVFGPLPKTSTGKIQKFELRERAKEL